MYEPELLPGKIPDATIWVVGMVFILLAALIIGMIISLAISIYDDARYRGAPAVWWAVATIIGGWLTMMVWMVVRDRYDESEVRLSKNKH